MIHGPNRNRTHAPPMYIRVSVSINLETRGTVRVRARHTGTIPPLTPNSSLRFSIGDTHTTRRLADQPMAAPEASGSGSQAGAERRLRMMCSHGGCFAPCGPHGAARYVGGETRVLAVPRGVSFRELVARLEEMLASGGRKIVTALRYRLADDEEVLVSATCDEELAHLRDEYDRLQATRPSATFRVFFSGVQRPAASGRPPLHPGTLRRVQSDPCTAARVAGPAPPLMRRVQTAQDLARFQPCCYYDKPGRGPDQYAPPMRPLLSAMSKNSYGAIRQGQELMTAKKTADAVIAEAAALYGSWSEIRV
uniref:PB1 domain-containing protein n=1 Tax=Aegilops tauschii subsp. strangulata TaxID=200361 RepID=A0A453H415_AEGTS